MALNLRYVIIAQIGIRHWLRFHKANDGSLPDFWEYICSISCEIDNAGDLGLAIWAAIESDGGNYSIFVEKLVSDWAQLRKACNAVELAWVVQGMVCLSQCQSMTDETTDVLKDSYGRLIGLYRQDTGLFARHDRKGLRGAISRRIASFADQVYPILALANYGKHFNDSQSVDAAVAVADMVCRLQGPKGQWWWHYDVKIGRVAEEYPVFSVHQDGMAPMALLAIDKVAGTNHSAYIEKGLMWLNKCNELQEKMILPQQGVIWRDIHRREISKMYRIARGVLITAGLDPIHSFAGRNLFGYVVNRECRPYHLGWILYTWASELARSDTLSGNTPSSAKVNSTLQQECTMKIISSTISNKEKNSVDILGLSVNRVTMEQLLRIIDERIASREQLLLGVVNVAKIVNVHRNHQLRQSLNQADFILADGRPIVWLSRMLGDPLPERVTGVDVMFKLLKEASKKSYRVYLLGAKPSVLQKAIRVVQREYPGICIAGYRDGFFGKDEERSVAEDIRKSRADILFVGISSPKKENFLRRWHRHMNVPVCHGVGGSFDILAGVTTRAPLWMRKWGLEWLYRLIQEPRRLWRRYLFTNAIFLKLSLEAIIRSSFSKLLCRFILKSASKTKDSK